MIYVRTERPIDGYLGNLAGMVGLEGSKAVTTPGVPMRDLKDWEMAPLDAQQHTLFRAVVGKIQWIVRVRPDVLYATKELSRRLVAPRIADLAAAKRVVKYLDHTRQYGLHLTVKEGPLELVTA